MPKVEKELTPEFYDPKDPNNLVTTRYQSYFILGLIDTADTRVLDALAGHPLTIFKAYGPSRELDDALYAWSLSFGINFIFVVSAARRTLRRWSLQPSTLERKSWALTTVDGGAAWERRPEGPLAKASSKRQRDGRSKYVAFQWLAKQHVFGYSARQIAKTEGLDYSDVARQIKRAAEMLGIVLKKPKSGRPVGAKTKSRQHIP